MQQTRYLPFGGYRAGNGPNPITSHAYTSQRENMDIGLYYYNARYYAPTLARFLSPDTLIPDPANPQAFNRYSYVLNFPLNYSDPTGHIACNTLGTEKCSKSGQFDDSTEQSSLPTNEALPSQEHIIEIANTFNIPPQLLWSLLQTIQAIDYDSGDVTEDFLLSIIGYGSNPAITHFPVNLPFKFVSPLAKGAFGRHPSPGIAQMQLRRATQTEEWLSNRAAANDTYIPMRDTLGSSENTADLLVRLLDPDTAATYVAAHTRMLMEGEFGLNVNAADLTNSDMALIMAQYNYGPRSEIPEPSSGYSFLHYYRVGMYYLSVWDNFHHK